VYLIRFLKCKLRSKHCGRKKPFDLFHPAGLCACPPRIREGRHSSAVNISTECPPVDVVMGFRKHVPKKILKIEEKLPIPAADKP
jgi:hypothetical protein